MTTLFDKVQANLKQKLPFVIYKKPNDDNLIGFFQKTNELFLIDDFTEKGFIFCSFNSDKNVIIPENQSEIIIEDIVFEKQLEQTNFIFSESEKDKKKFQSLVQKSIDTINNLHFDKIVVSRKIEMEIANFDIIKTFKKSINFYKSAFCYVFYHPKIGLWTGATPEQLLKIEDQKFETVSLAGTQKFNNQTNIFWQEKEKQEQQFVTDFIFDSLKHIGLNPKKSEPFSIIAGNLIHIKTTISTNINPDFDLKKTIAVLHPTPAICGLPKQQSKEFIINNEAHHREFYTGFLGELNFQNKTDLFVNLRCMKIKKNKASIYVGCGITKDSIPEQEWQETVNKSFTMKNLLM